MARTLLKGAEQSAKTCPKVCLFRALCSPTFVFRAVIDPRKLLRSIFVLLCGKGTEKAHSAGYTLDMKGDPNFSDIFLGEIRRAGVDLWVRCPSCGHDAMIAATKIRHPDTVRLAQLADVFHCTHCNRRGGQGVQPEPKAWVQHLRRTGQYHRLPYWAPMMP